MISQHLLQTAPVNAG